MLNSINTLVPAPNTNSVEQNKKNQSVGGAGVNLVVTPFRNMRGLHYKKKLGDKNNNAKNGGLELSKDSKIIRRRSSDNSSMNSSRESSSPGGSTRSSISFMKRRSSLLSALIIKEEDSNGLDGGSRKEGNSAFAGAKASSMLGKRISDDKNHQQSSKQSNSYDKAQESNTRTILSHRTDDGTVGHVTIAYKASNHTFTLNPKALDELTSALEEFNNDKAIKLIVVSSSGRGIFCAGVDISCLITNDLMKRKLLAEDLGKRIKNLFQTLLKLKKVTVASLNGDAEGLGVTMLPLFDLVYASDKCTFKLTPEYSEGVSIFGSEYVRHNKIINSMIYAGKRLTAQEAMNAGLITEILWPAKFHEELFLRIKNVLKIHRSAQTMESLKRIVKGQVQGNTLTSASNAETGSSNNGPSFRTSLDIESKYLVENWISNKFQEKHKKGLNSKVIKC
jgi:enoyl-CoA hydratase/carnithine racemase